MPVDNINIPCLYVYMHVYMSTCLHVYMSTCLHVYMSTCLHVNMSTYTQVIVGYVYVCVTYSAVFHPKLDVVVARNISLDVDLRELAVWVQLGECERLVHRHCHCTTITEELTRADLE